MTTTTKPGPAPGATPQPSRQHNLQDSAQPPEPARKPESQTSKTPLRFTDWAAI